MSSASNMFTDRSDIRGSWVAVMHHRRHDRRMVPSPWTTRALRAGEIHEFVLCRPGNDRSQEMNDVSYLGFAELHNGGVVAVDDSLEVGGRVIGTVYGFDETHHPNHYNILIATDDLVTGSEIGLSVQDPITFRPAGPSA